MSRTTRPEEDAEAEGDRRIVRRGTVGSAGEQLGSYRLVRKIGRGGMGEVWVAEHVQIKSQVAIKLVLGDPEDAGIAERFLREAKATARVRHPGIITVSDYGPRDGGGAYLVMELLDGVSLAERLQTPVSLELALDVGAQIADALDAAHTAGVIHRDLKPGNVFLVTDPASRSGVRVKLLDFGVAKSTSRVTDELGMTVTGALVGTPFYMAPEQCTSRRGPVDHRADLYALGIVLYEMLTGTPPFGGPALGDLIEQHLTMTPVPPRELVPEIPELLDTLIGKLLAKHRADRIGTAIEVARILRSLRDGTPVGAHELERGKLLAFESPRESVERRLARALSPTFAAEAATDSSARRAAHRRRMFEEIDSAARRERAGTAQTGMLGARELERAGRMIDGDESEVAKRALPDSAERAPPVHAVTIRPSTSRRRRIWIAWGVAIVVAIGVAIWLLRGSAVEVAALDDTTLDRRCRDGDGEACLVLGLREARTGLTPDLPRLFTRVLTACDRGVADGCAHASWMYSWGAGVRADYPRARALAEQACTAGSGSGCDLAGELLAGGIGGPRDGEGAQARSRRGCELGHPGACHAAGSRKLYGIGIALDPAGGRELHLRAWKLARERCAEQDPTACRVAAVIHAKGIVVPRDLARAAVALQHACELGSPEACGEVGELYALGVGVTKDPVRAEQSLRRACERGAGGSCSALAVAIANGLAGPADPAKALALARESCEVRGDRNCGVLGNFYQIGTGTPQDFKVAAIHYERACATGDADACASAADIFIPGVTRDAAKIDALVEQACGLGSAHGCFKLGRRATKRGNHAPAIAAFERACAMSDQQIGCAELAGMYLDGTGVPPDPARGRKLLDDACETSAQIACHALGERLRDGKAITARPAEALPLFEKACNLGWGKACIAAADLLTQPAWGLSLDAARATTLRDKACKSEPRLCAK